MISDLVVWPPSHARDPFQLVIFILFIACSELFHPVFALFPSTVTEYSRENATVFHLSHLSGCFCHLSRHQPVCQTHYIRRMDAEEDVQDLRLLSSGFHPPQRVVLFLRTERSLHHCGPHPRQLPSHHVLLVAFPQQFLVRRISHLTFIARSVRVHRVQVLHVRLPGRRQLVLQLLDLHLPRQLQRNVVKQFVVRQRPFRADADTAENLVVNVPVQLLHQSWHSAACTSSRTSAPLSPPV